jgi:hypothetical protein
MSELIGSMAYVATVISFALHLLFDRRCRQRLQTLERQHYQLRRELDALKRLESWVPGNAAFSHAPWVLVRLSCGYYRVASRHSHAADLRFLQETFTEAFSGSGSYSDPVYRLCFDLFGVFGDDGSFDLLKELSDEGCRLLKLSRPVVEPETYGVPESAEPASSCEFASTAESESTDPEAMTKERLPPFFSSRFC